MSHPSLSDPTDLSLWQSKPSWWSSMAELHYSPYDPWRKRKLQEVEETGVPQSFWGHTLNDFRPSHQLLPPKNSTVSHSANPQNCKSIPCSHAHCPWDNMGTTGLHSLTPTYHHVSPMSCYFSRLSSPLHMLSTIVQTHSFLLSGPFFHYFLPFRFAWSSPIHFPHLGFDFRKSSMTLHYQWVKLSPYGSRTQYTPQVLN